LAAALTAKLPVKPLMTGPRTTLPPPLMVSPAPLPPASAPLSSTHGGPVQPAPPWLQPSMVTGALIHHFSPLHGPGRESS